MKRSASEPGLELSLARIGQRYTSSKKEKTRKAALGVNTI